MSLLDLILAQSGILLTAGIALLLLTAAILLSVVSRVRQAAARTKRKALRAIQIQMQQQAAAAELPDQVEPVTDGKARAVPKAATGAPAAPPSPEAILSQALTAPENQQDQPAPDGVPNAMQAILSSVFGDDEVTAKYDTLLKGLEPINIEHLQALSSQIAEQLREQSGS